MFNEELANALQQDSPSLEVELPQRYASQIAEGPDFSRKMFNYSIAAIDDLMLSLPYSMERIRIRGPVLR
jgi:hypothetical protein